MLKIKELKKDFGAFELHAEFEVQPTERAAVFGPSGVGKTSLLRLIAGLETPDSGSIRLEGPGIEAIELTHLPVEKRQIGYVFQESTLFPSLNLIENVTFGLKMKRISRDEREAIALPWLDKVGLRSLAHSSVTQLSGGERQRVAFVRAILWKPRILLLDEPFSALDAPLRALLRKEIVELHHLWPVPLLFVTHDEADLESVATTRLKFAVAELKSDSLPTRAGRPVRKFFR